MRLRNRNHNLPGGFVYIQAESGFEAPKNLSFNGVVDAVVKHRQGNPYLAKKHGWSTDWESVAFDVETANALRMKSNPKFSHFIIDEGIGASSFSSPFRLPNQGRQGVVAGVKKTVAGVGVLLRMFGSGGRPVAKELAERRAAVCATGGPGGTRCPMNKPGNLSTFFTEAASSEIFKMFGILNDLQISTSKDAELGVCSGCLCPLKGKVQASISYIASEMKPEWKNDLNQENPRCWQLTELEAMK